MAGLARRAPGDFGMSIEIRNIEKSFGSFKALDNVSLDLPKG